MKYIWMKYYIFQTIIFHLPSLNANKSDVIIIIIIIYVII